MPGKTNAGVIDQEPPEELEEDQDQDDNSNEDDGETLDQVDADEDEGAEQGTEDEKKDAESEEVIVQIGDKPAEDQEHRDERQWIRDLRKRERQKDSAIRKLERELAEIKRGQEPAAVTLGAKPTLAECDFDGEVFDQRLSAWYDRKRQADEQQSRKAKIEEDAQAAWQAKLDAYKADQRALRVRDYDDVEAIAKDVLSITQQGVILSGADNPARVVYALGSNPKVLRDLGAITDPVKFATAIGKLEAQLKIVPKRTAPPPEQSLRGNVAGATMSNVQLDELRRKAYASGDMTAYFAAKRKLQK